MNAKAARLIAAAEGLAAGAVVVEIGCARFSDERASDGWSTVYLAQEAERHGWEFHSVDEDPAAIETARALTASLPVQFHRAEGAVWLSRFSRPIDFLYLDGSANPTQALTQYEMARLADQGIVVVDDVQPVDGHERGKGERLLDRLEEDGFSVSIYDTEPGYRMAVATQ